MPFFYGFTCKPPVTFTTKVVFKVLSIGYHFGSLALTNGFVKPDVLSFTYSHSIQVAVILVSSLDIMRFIRTEQHILITFFVLSIFFEVKGRSVKCSIDFNLFVVRYHAQCL